LAKVFRDPVHGDIELSGDLVELLDTPQMQRLRGIKQLGTACLVYPGALHTRFDHSLGTCWMAHRLLDGLALQGASVEAEDRRAILAAALLHDVGHIPYGHTLEDERRVFPRHDTAGRLDLLLGRGELGRALARQGLQARVRDLILGRAQPPWQSELVSATVDADLLDYLARDPYFCGLRHSYDPRLLRLFRIEGGHLYLEAQKQGIVRQDALSEIINLLRLRYFLTERVYFHHTKTASGAMISRMVEQATRLGLRLADVVPLSDERLLATIEQRYGGDPVVARLAAALKGRRLHKRVYVLTRRIGEERRRQFVARYHNSAAGREEAEEHLTRRLRLRPGELIVYCPALEMQFKEAEVRVRVDPGAPRSLASLGIAEVAVLRDRYQDLWRFYVFAAAERLDKARAISLECEKYFGESNHLPALQGGQMYLELW
jgi:HD superfamily phosphohydrolase